MLLFFEKFVDFEAVFCGCYCLYCYAIRERAESRISVSGWAFLYSPRVIFILSLFTLTFGFKRLHSQYFISVLSGYLYFTLRLYTFEFRVVHTGDTVLSVCLLVVLRLFTKNS